MNKYHPFKALVLAPALLWLLSTSYAHAEPKDRWLQKWNQQADPSFQLKAEDLFLQESTSGDFPGLLVAGIRQSDGSYNLAKIVWKDRDYTPLAGLGAVLHDLPYAELDDQGRTQLFLKLLQETYGAIGVKPYTGEASKVPERPMPISGLRTPDGSHRFRVWLYKLPVRSEDGEWREMLFTVSADGSEVRTKNLNSFMPHIERLRDFPTPSSELFE